MWKCEYVMVSRVECKPHLFDCQPQWVVADKITFHVSFQIDPCDVMGFIKKNIQAPFFDYQIDPIVWTKRVYHDFGRNGWMNLRWNIVNIPIYGIPDGVHFLINTKH